MDLTTGSNMGRFTIGERMTATGLATTFAATDMQGKRPAVLKVFRTYFADEPELLARYFEAVRRVEELGHPNIVPVLEVGRERQAWIVTERMAGGNVERLVGHPPAWQELVKLLTQVGKALSAAQAIGVRHWDIKPSNIFIDDAGDYRLGDFGMYILGAGGDPLVRSSSNTPMPAYMAPEHATEDALTERSDVYSLGILLYHVLSGGVPFPGNAPAIVWAKQTAQPPADLRPLVSGLPNRAWEVIRKALAVEPEDRFETAGALAEAFRDAVATAPAAQAVVTDVGEAASAGRVEGRAAANESVQCHACRHLNPPGVIRCESCWSMLDQSDVVNEETTARARAARALRDKRNQLVGVGALAAAILLAMVLQLTLGGSAVPPLVPGLTSASAADQWAMHQLDPTHSGFRPGPAPVLRGETRWTLVSSGQVNSGPVVSAGVVYSVTGDRRMLALDADTGEQIWEVKGLGVANSTPAIAGGALYVGFGSSVVSAIDIATGERLWNTRTDGPIYAAPVVKDGLVYVGTGQGTLHALDALSGKERWKVTVGGWIGSAPAISDDDVLVFGARDGNVYLLDAKTGKSQLRYRTVNAVESGPVIVGDRAYMGTDAGAITVLDLTERRRLLDRQFLRVRQQLFVWNLLGSVPIQRGLEWSRQLSGRGGIIVTSPVITDTSLYATSRNGRVYAVDLDSRDIRWQVAVGRQNPTSPVVVGDRVIVGTGEGRVVMLDTRTGEEVWEWSAFPGSSIVATPAVVGSRMYVTAVQIEPPAMYFDAASRSEANLSSGWYYQYEGNPCVPEPEPVGPFPSREEAMAQSRYEGKSCSVLYAIE